MNKSKKSLTLGLVCAFALVAFVALIAWLNVDYACHADKTNIKIGDKFEINIKRDKLIYDEKSNSDCLAVYMTATYVGPEPDDLEEHNTTGYTDETPLSTEITPEQEQNLSYEESEKINEKTIYVIQNQEHKYVYLANYARCVGVQNNIELEEPKDLYRGDSPEDESNSAAMAQGVKSGGSFDFTLYYSLKDTSDFSLYFISTIQDENGENQVDIDTVVFDINKFPSYELAKNREQKYIDIETNKPETAEVKGIKVDLLDGWYVSNQGQANIALLNSKLEKAKININLQPTELSAKDMIKNTPGWGNDEVKEIDLGGKHFYYATHGSQSFVATYKASNGNVVRIMGYSLEFDDAKPILETLSN